MTQTERFYNLLEDGKPHRTDETLRVVYGSEHNGIAMIGAHFADLKGSTNYLMQEMRCAASWLRSRKKYLHDINPC